MRTTLLTSFLITLSTAGINAQPTISSIAGSPTGSCSFTGDGGPATSATLCNPMTTAIDAAGTIYLPDSANWRIRRITPAGVITTIAGTGVRGTSGDGGPALAANLGGIQQLAFDGQNRLCFGDTDAYKVRCIDLNTGIITGLGNGNSWMAGDDGPAANASFQQPWGAAFAPRPPGATPGPPDLYITEFSGGRIRKIDSVTGIVTNFAGGWGTPLGDGGPATGAMLSFPSNLRFYNGALYVGDSGNQRIRKIDLATNIITTVAGNGSPYFAGDGGPATAAQLTSPGGVDFDGSGNMYISDRGAMRIRKVDSAGIITTIAGNGLSGLGNDNVLATLGIFSGISGLTWNAADNSLIVSDGSNRLRRIGLVKTTTTVSTSPNPSTLGGAVVFSAAVSPNTAAGTVTFYAQSLSTLVTQNMGTATVLGGVASVTSPDLGSGPQNVWAVYSGGPSHNPSTSGILNHQVRFTSYTVLTSVTPNPAVAGSPVTLTANVYPPSGQTGTVQFFDGAALLGSVALGNGVAQFTTSSLAAGAHSLSAAYSGSADWANSSSAPVSLTVNKTATTTALTSSPMPSTFGAGVTLTATVSPATVTGAVQFFLNGTSLGTATVANGVATLATTSLPAGTNQLTAAYNGDALFNSSTSAARAHTVNKANSTTTLALSATQINVGQSVTFTATVSPAALATGTVQFMNGTTPLGTATVNNGTATFTTSTLAAGNYSIRAVYGGSANVNGSQSGTLSLRVRRP